jgi:hypothetical protein
LAAVAGSEGGVVTLDEWEALSYLAFTEWWDQPMDPQRQAVWFGELRGFSVAEVEYALRNLLESAPTFAPKLGQLLNELRPKPPAWEEIWPCVSRTLARVSPTYRGERAALDAIRAQCGDLAAGWAATYGVKRLSLEPVFDADAGGIIEARLRKSFTEQVRDPSARDRAQLRLQNALGAGKTRQLEAGDAEAGAM